MTFYVAALRAQFLVECLADLRKNLQKYDLDLLIRHGKPEEILPSLAESFGAHTVKQTYLMEYITQFFVIHNCSLTCNDCSRYMPTKKPAAKR